MTSAALENQEIWHAHLQELFQELDIPPGPLADNVIASVAMYCREFHAQGVQQNDLKLLIARAFCAVGDRAAAERVLVSMPTHGRHTARWLEILSELHHFPQLLPYFSLGIIRPADWAGAQLDRMWTLDFGLLALSDAERHEMMLYRSVRALVEQLFIFWNATCGAGVLGLKGLGALNVGGNSGRRKALSACDDLLEYIEDLFRRQMRCACWQCTPTVLNLDL